MHNIKKTLPAALKKESWIKIVLVVVDYQSIQVLHILMLYINMFYKLSDHNRKEVTLKNNSYNKQVKFPEMCKI